MDIIVSSRLPVLVLQDQIQRPKNSCRKETIVGRMNGGSHPLKLLIDPILTNVHHQDQPS